MKNSQVAHIWAQQTQSEGHGSNFFFKGKTIYSYGEHFPIASFQKNGVILVNTSYYSNTTNMHQQYVTCAVGSYFTVKNVLPTNKADHRKNHDEMMAVIKKSMLTLSKARVGLDNRLRVLNNKISDCNKYASAFSLRRTPLETINNIEDLRILTGKQVAALKAFRKKEKIKIAKAYKLLKVDALDAKIQWMDGKLEKVAYKYRELLPILLRCRGENVETSEGASFPLSHAKKAWAVIKKVKASGSDWVPQKSVVKLGHFAINFIKKNGDLKAGCHDMTYEIMEDFAEKNKFN